MYLAITNNHGWARHVDKLTARKLAIGQSLHDRAQEVHIYPCEPTAYVDGMGACHGLTKEPGERWEKDKRGRWQMTGTLPTTSV